MRYGWYYDGGYVQDDGEDVWALIESAVLEAAEEGRLHALMVGPMRSCSVTDIFDADDVVSMCADGRLTPDEIVEVIAERHSESVYDGTATLASAEAKPAFARIVRAHRRAEDAAEEIVQWATDHVTLDPASACHGRRPIPLELVEGEWIFGDRETADTEPAAVITYATEFIPETGDVGWCWWACGAMGDAPTLREAMARAEAAVLRFIDNRMAVL